MNTTSQRNLWYAVARADSSWSRPDGGGNGKVILMCLPLQLWWNRYFPLWQHNRRMRPRTLPCLQLQQDHFPWWYGFFHSLGPQSICALLITSYFYHGRRIVRGSNAGQIIRRTTGNRLTIVENSGHGTSQTPPYSVSACSIRNLNPTASGISLTIPPMLLPALVLHICKRVRHGRLGNLLAEPWSGRDLPLSGREDATSTCQNPPPLRITRDQTMSVSRILFMATSYFEAEHRISKDIHPSFPRLKKIDYQKEQS